jgi:hypothetical protein
MQMTVTYTIEMPEDDVGFLETYEQVLRQIHDTRRPV